MDKLSELAAREWRADARAAHDDPLLDCLVEITRLHGVTATAQALSSGLPLEEHRLTPALLPRAAAIHYAKLARYGFPLLLVMLFVLPMISPQTDIVHRFVAPIAGAATDFFFGIANLGAA